MRLPAFTRYACLALLLLLTQSVWAHPELLDELMGIAEPDQIEAYQQLDLTPQQREQLLGVARGMLPEVKKTEGDLFELFALMPLALQRADAVLTPRQRPLLRRLVPRAHQWDKVQQIAQRHL